MTLRKAFAAIGLAAALLVLGYWYSATHTAARLIEALNRGDSSSIDAMFDWDKITPAVANDVATSFPDPRAQALARLLTGTFKSIVLRSHTVPVKSRLRIASAGFASLDDYIVTSSSGNRWILRRYGLRWLVDGFLPTLANARKLGREAVALADPAAKINIAAGDLYFGNPQYGCRLTTTADVTDFAASSSQIAYVRMLNAHSFIPHTQLWLLNLTALKPVLAVDGSEPNDVKASTDDQQDLTFSLDGRFVYFSAYAWATSGAIVSLDTKTLQTRFVSDGNGLAVIGQGKYRGDLLTEQHQYHAAGGSYEEAVILDRKGNVLAYLTPENLPWSRAVEIVNAAE